MLKLIHYVYYRISEASGKEEKDRTISMATLGLLALYLAPFILIVGRYSVRTDVGSYLLVIPPVLILILTPLYLYLRKDLETKLHNRYKDESLKKKRLYGWLIIFYYASFVFIGPPIMAHYFPSEGLFMIVVQSIENLFS